ncbi:MAG: FeoB-associated Cys-rich membrane protein [Bacteroidetes bacterium]|nr:FeoB-associated Cys-rich membrane protein [Bacteroidota bacterium]NOS91744.1 FeoB-associated Cys-rich membrane protein [Cyclobacteriaceae bacterium]
MLQIILIGILFAGAAFYLGRMVYRSFQSKQQCASGCGKCGLSEVKE